MRYPSWTSQVSSPLRLLRREDQNVVLADGVFGLDRDAEGLGALCGAGLRRGPCGGGPAITVVDDSAAGVLIEVLHQPRRGVGVEVLQDRPIGDVDLAFLQRSAEPG